MRRIWDNRCCSRMAFSFVHEDCDSFFHTKGGRYGIRFGISSCCWCCRNRLRLKCSISFVDSKIKNNESMLAPRDNRRTRPVRTQLKAISFLNQNSNTCIDLSSCNNKTTTTTTTMKKSTISLTTSLLLVAISSPSIHCEDKQLRGSESSLIPFHSHRIGRGMCYLWPSLRNCRRNVGHTDRVLVLRCVGADGEEAEDEQPSASTQGRD